MKLCIQNIPFSTTEEQLRQAFEQVGPVSSVKLIYDKEDNRPKGFGFVEMPNDKDGLLAINELDGSDFFGRPMRVEQARERQPYNGGGRGQGNRR